jgi:hypothetical protein
VRLVGRTAGERVRRLLTPRPSGNRGCGSRSTTCCTSSSGSAKADGRPRAQRSWTASSVKTTERGRHGDDGAKKVNGRKRHLLVDTLGLVCKVQVTAADVGDRDGAMALLRRLDRRRSPGCGTAGPTAAT